MSTIFFITSILAKIHNTSVLLKGNKNVERKVIINNTSKNVFKKEMKNQTERINYILAIVCTLGEALNYIEQNYKNNPNLQVKIVLNDSIVAVNTINRALESMDSDLNDKNIKLETNNLESLLNELMHAFDENNIQTIEKIINYKLTNEYNHWKTDIENEFR
ncbi:hypothetical protein [Clostridium tagluense]|uniref:hypothetical protein n=1 Tax=Clostridium tagluense TaxID=360422 RepID=UPI001C0B4BDC|nr:hypothetical protein [Clostridium tagluense]MBU3126658.1 hypothetical protein [Clostridium tagluense]